VLREPEPHGNLDGHEDSSRDQSRGLPPTERLALDAPQIRTDITPAVCGDERFAIDLPNDKARAHPVLGVDDDPAAREIMQYALEERGALVTVAPGAGEAFDLLLHRDFDVLLADIAMPDEDGCALLRRIRASGNARIASIPAAAVTAHASEDERRAVLAAGFQLHLVKPIEPAELARAVERLTRGGQTTSPV